MVATLACTDELLAVTNRRGFFDSLASSLRALYVFNSALFSLCHSLSACLLPGPWTYVLAIPNSSASSSSYHACLCYEFSLADTFMPVFLSAFFKPRECMLH